MFEQYAQALQSEVPHLTVEGEGYPPPRINEILSNVLFGLRMVCIAVLLGGPQLLQAIGIQNPPWIYNWAQDNKVCVCVEGRGNHTLLGVACEITRTHACCILLDDNISFALPCWESNRRATSIHWSI